MRREKRRESTRGVRGGRWRIAVRGGGEGEGEEWLGRRKVDKGGREDGHGGRKRKRRGR